MTKLSSACLCLALLAALLCSTLAETTGMEPETDAFGRSLLGDKGKKAGDKTVNKVTQKNVVKIGKIKVNGAGEVYIDISQDNDVDDVGTKGRKLLDTAQDAVGRSLLGDKEKKEKKAGDKTVNKVSQKNVVKIGKIKVNDDGYVYIDIGQDNDVDDVGTKGRKLLATAQDSVGRNLLGDKKKKAGDKTVNKVDQKNIVKIGKIKVNDDGYAYISIDQDNYVDDVGTKGRKLLATAEDATGRSLLGDKGKKAGKKTVNKVDQKNVVKIGHIKVNDYGEVYISIDQDNNVDDVGGK